MVYQARRSDKGKLTGGLATAIQEEERQRIALELHDTAVQELIVAYQLLSALLDTAPENKEPLRQLESLLGGSLKQLRNTLSDLQLPPPSCGLSLSLFHLLQDLHRQGGTSGHLVVEGKPLLMPEWQTINIYRIAQEAFTNVRRHSQARNVSLYLGYEPGKLALEIRDDGRGFDISAVGKSLITGQHLGLKGMRDRALTLGGQLDLWSQPGAGTRVCLIVPWQQHRK